MVAKYRDRHSFRCSNISSEPDADVEGKAVRVKIACGRPKLSVAEVLKAAAAGDLKSSTTIVDARHDLLDAIVAYDKSICGVDRTKWCQNWLLEHKTGRSVVALRKINRKDASVEMAEGHKLVDTVVFSVENPVLSFKSLVCSNTNDLNSNNGDFHNAEAYIVAGFGQIHEVRPDKLQIGPLYADNASVARTLLVGLLSKFSTALTDELTTYIMAFQAEDCATEAMLEDFGFEALSDYYEVFMFTKHEVPFARSRTIFFADTAVNFV